MRNKNANPTMRATLIILALMAVMLGATITACSSANEAEGLTSERGKHGGEGGEGGEGGKGGEGGHSEGDQDWSNTQGGTLSPRLDQSNLTVDVL